jgi:hypothetical protein
MATTSDYSVRVEGINELVRAFGQLDQGLRKHITDQLRVLARDVQSKAREIAVAEGFAPPGRSRRATGALVQDIRYSVRGGTAFVREDASRDGFLYPAVFEYGHSEKWGHRPFLEPALSAEGQHIQEGMEHMLDGLLRGF